MSRSLIALLVVVGVVVLALVLVAVAKDKPGAPYLGVVPSEVTSDVATDYGVKAGMGVLISKVAADSPADSAGLRVNDVVTSVNGTAVTGPEEFRNQIAKSKVGDQVTLVYLRGGKEHTAKITLAEREMKHTFNFGPFGSDEHRFQMEGPPWEWHSSKTGEKAPFAGLVTQSLSDGLAQYFKVDKGALVSEVVKDSPAEKAGLKPGDVIVKIGGTSIEDEGDVRAAIREHKVGDDVDFVVKRDGQDVTLKVKLGERDSSKDMGERIMKFGDGSEDGSGLVILPDKEDLDQLGEELRIELKDLPDIHWDSLKEDLNIPQLKVEIEKLRTIKDDPELQKNLQELKDNLKAQKRELKKELKHLKVQVRELRDRAISV
jgi:hypothetical protein